MNYKKIKKALKQHMKIVMNNCAENLKKNGRVSTKSLGLMIRSIHMFLPTYLMTILMFGPLFLCNIAIISLVGAIVCFYLFDCCFISILERNICDDDFIVTDPILEMLSLPINNHNRYYISNVVGPLYLYLAFVVYYVRFYHHSN